MRPELLYGIGLRSSECCLPGSGPLVSLLVISDVLIGLACLAIAGTLALLAFRARKVVPFSLAIVALAAFIVSFGLGRFTDVLPPWVPLVWFSGFLKIATATIAVSTALMLPAFIPRTVAMLHAGWSESGSYFRDISDRMHGNATRAQLDEHSRVSMTARADELEKRNHDAMLIVRLTQRLPACCTQTELGEVVGKVCEQLFPDSPGALYVSRNTEPLLYEISNWGTPAGAVAEFAPDECWALRRGQSHIVDDTMGDVVCPHVSQDRVRSYRCMPLVAQGQAVGVFYIESAVAQRGSDDRVLDMLAEVVSLSLVNLQLRETLRHQSVRDPLTGLFNRRHLIEMLDHENARSDRTGMTASMLMVDIDNFKLFNDTYGHEAGDSVMKLVSTTMQGCIRKTDIACRYGGEEFAILLPDTSLRAGAIVGEKLRVAIRAMKPCHRGLSVEPVTISIGLAEHAAGACSSQLIDDADQALYAAKRAGRDRLEIFGGVIDAPEAIVRDRELPLAASGINDRRAPRLPDSRPR